MPRGRPVKIQDTVNVLIRLPASLKEEAHTIAQREGVSLNAFVTASIVMYHARVNNIPTTMTNDAFLSLLEEACYIEKHIDITGNTYVNWTNDGRKVKNLLKNFFVDSIRE